MKLQIFALFALFLFATSQAAYLERTLYIPVTDMGMIKHLASNGAFVRQQTMSGQDVLIGNEVGDGLLSDSRAYFVFDTSSIPRRAYVGQVNLTYDYSSTSNGIKILNFADSYKRLGNTNATNANWYWNASQTWNASWKIVGSSVSGQDTTTLALSRVDPESVKLQFAALANENYTIAALLDKLENPLNTFVKIKGNANGKPVLAVQVFVPDPRGQCGNDVRGFRDTILRYNQNGWMLFNSSEYDAVMRIRLNGEVLNSDFVDWDLCFGSDNSNNFKFGANVTLTPAMRTRAVNMTIEIGTNYGFRVPEAFKVEFPTGQDSDVWNFNDLVQYASSIGLNATSEWRDGRGYRITLTGFTNSTPLLLVLDPSIGETDWSNSSENVILSQAVGGPLNTPNSCADNTIGVCPVFNQSGCANDSFACGTGTAYGLKSLNDNQFFSTNGYFQFWGAVDGGTLVGTQFPPGWISADAARYVCVNQSAIRDESVTAARQWTVGSYIYIGNSSLNWALKGVYDIAYSNTSLGAAGPRNHTWSFPTTCGRYITWFLNSTTVGTNGASISEIAYRGYTYGENYSTNASYTNQSVNNVTFTYDFTYVPGDYLNVSNATLFFNHTTAKYFCTWINGTGQWNISCPVNISGFTTGTDAYWMRIQLFTNATDQRNSFFNTSTKPIVINNNALTPPAQAPNGSIFLMFPVNNSKYALGLVPFSLNVSFFGANVSNVTLLGNFSGTWTANATNTTMLNVTNQNVTFTIGLYTGAYRWSAFFCLTNGACNYSNTNFTVEITGANKSIVPVTPANNSDLVTGTRPFIVTSTFSGRNLANVTLIGNFSGTWGDNETNTTVIANSPVSTTFNLGVAIGVYGWTARLCLTDGTCNYSNTNFTVNVVAPLSNMTVNLTSPTNGFELPFGLVNFTTTTTFTGSNVANITLYGNFSGTWGANATNTTVLSSSPATHNMIIGLAPGTYTWNALVCLQDSHCEFSSQNYTLQIRDTSIYWTNLTAPNVGFGRIAWINVTWNTVGGNLSHYIFSTNQSGAWVNSSSVQFVQIQTMRINISVTGLGSQNNNFVFWHQVWANNTDGLYNATPIQALIVTRTYNNSATNETMVQTLSDMIGTGFQYSFGDPLLIGIVIAIFFLGLMYLWGFTLDVIIPIMLLLIFGMTGIGSNPALYPTAPSWIGGIGVLAIILFLMYAYFKFVRR